MMLRDGNEWCYYRLASSDPGSNEYACAVDVAPPETCTRGCCTVRDPFRVPESERVLVDTPEA